jgi:hypothetical protein
MYANFVRSQCTSPGTLHSYRVFVFGPATSFPGLDISMITVRP